MAEAQEASGVCRNNTRCNVVTPYDLSRLAHPKSHRAECSIGIIDGGKNAIVPHESVEVQRPRQLVGTDDITKIVNSLHLGRGRSGKIDSAKLPLTIDESEVQDRKSTRLNSSHRCISYAVFCLKKKKKKT